MENLTSINDDPVLNWSSIVVRGEQASVFLQGQLSQDIARVTGGAWTLVLAPDSVVITSGFITGSGDEFDLRVPRELGDVALTRLRRFLLRTRCTIELEATDRGPYATLGARIDAGEPGPDEFAAKLTPHSFGSSFVERTVSFAKGCYTGQELVGRLDARGSKVPWRLVRVAGGNRQSLDETLRSKGPQGPSGLTSAVVNAQGVVGLGIAHRTLLDDEGMAQYDDVRIEAIA